MRNRLWEYRNNQWTGDNRMVHYFSGNIYQALVCDQQGNLLYHIIEECDSPPPIETLKIVEAGEMLEMDFESPVQMQPGLFSEIEIPGASKNHRIQDLNAQLNFRYPGSKAVHAFSSFFHEAEKCAKKYATYLQIFVHGKSCMIVFFRDGKCEIGNSYEVQNESEVLYYAMAVIKTSGVDVRKVKIELLSNSPEEYLKLFHRFVPEAQVLRIELPYETGQYPPYAAEAFLMHQFLVCELPVAN